MPDPAWHGKLAYLIAIPTDRASFVRALERGSGYLAANGYATTDDWHRYAPTAAAMQHCIRLLQKHADVFVDARLVEWEGAVRNYPVVGLLAHLDSGEGGRPVELADGSHTFEELANATPSEAHRLLDLTLCNSRALGQALRQRLPNATSLVGNGDLSPHTGLILWLQYLSLLRSAADTRESYVDAVESVRHSGEDRLASTTRLAPRAFDSPPAAPPSPSWMPPSPYVEGKPIRLGGSAPQAAANPGSGSGSAPVHFTASAPRNVYPGRTCTLQAWLHTEGQRDEVRQRIIEANAYPPVKTTEGPADVPLGSSIDIEITSDEFGISEPMKSVRWEGKISSATFSAVVKEGVTHSASFALRFLVGGIPVAKVHLTCAVAPLSTGVDDEEPKTASASRIERAFASHASSDKAKVLARIQGMQAVAPWMSVFYDSTFLKMGERWRDRICVEIERSEVIFLFWSRAAKKSRVVRWEWSLALNSKGQQAICPVPLEPPATAPPPQELEALHFNFWALPHIAEAERARRRWWQVWFSRT